MPKSEPASRQNIAAEVLDFYESLPFNMRDSVAEAVTRLKNHDPVDSYPPLKGILRKKSVLEVGCGVGWFSNGLAYHHKTQVRGIDFNPVAVTRSSEVAKAVGLSSQFDVADIFEFLPSERVDVVVSLGVLHHTGDCHGAIRRICQNFLKPEGYFLLGLYHTYGRHPFLAHFDSMKNSGASEDDLYEEFKRIRGGNSDETHLRSWFRDQVIHPHETQHSFEEIATLLEECEMKIISTSINKYEKIQSMSAIVAEEKKYREISIEQLKRGVYFPGFFTVMAQHK